MFMYVVNRQFLWFKSTVAEQLMTRSTILFSSPKAASLSLGYIVYLVLHALLVFSGTCSPAQSALHSARCPRALQADGDHEHTEAAQAAALGRQGATPHCKHTVPTLP